ncbi:MAG: M16 family metallopeptidase [Gemmataceae bacterium]
MTFRELKLDNGLQIVGETSPSARSVALGFFVKTGSRDETSEACGVSHFLEHMVFKGTPKRTAMDVNLAFDRIGANYNAFTSEENTVFYAAILPEYLPIAVDLLADILRPSLREDDFNTEKEVIIEEIGMYDDQPVWSTYDRAKQIYFASHPLGNSILGTEESIRALTPETMRAYFERRYVPSNITVAVAGAFDWDEFVSLIQQHCGHWEVGEAPREGISETLGSGEFQLLPKETITQEHCMLMSAGPSVDSPLIYASNILGVIFGDDSGSRLYWAVVDPGHADSADASFHEYIGTGVYYTMFSCDPGKAQHNLELIQGLLHQLQQEGVTEQELKTAKTKVMARLVRGSERPMGRMQAIGSMWNDLDVYRTVDEELDRFNAVTLDSIREVLDKYPIDRTTIVAHGPLTELNKPE